MSWAKLPPHLAVTATSTLTARQLEAWKLELAGMSTRRISQALGISRASTIDRLDNAHRRLRQAGITQTATGEWTITEAA